LIKSGDGMIRTSLVMALCGFAHVHGFSDAAALPMALDAVRDASHEKLAGLDGIINHALATFNVPGGAVGIVVNGQVVLCQGFGVRDRENNVPVTENTLFAIGSCTKAFTTFVIGQLVDEGRLSWDDPVIKYLPELRLKDEYATLRLTMRDLVTHRSGLPRHDFLWYNSDFSREEILNRLQHLEFSSEFREKFQYNNVMYGVAGLVIEKVTGQTWENELQTRIFAPLRMGHSNFSVEDSQANDDFAQPHMEKEDRMEKVPFRKITNVGPAGSINSTASDMVKWLQLQLSGGSVAENALIKKTTLQEMHTMQMAIPAYPTETFHTFGYGLGWMIGMYDGHYCVSHGGGIDGFISHVALLPEEGIGVVVLSNSSPNGYGFVASMTNAVLDRLVGAKDEDWVAKWKEKWSQLKAAQIKEAANQASSSLSVCDLYIGNYAHPAYGMLKLSEKEGHLLAEYNQIGYNLRHSNHDVFTAAFNEYENHQLSFQFFRSVSGEISEVRIPFEPAVEPIVFKKMPDHQLLSIEYLKSFTGTFEAAGISVEIVLQGSQLVVVAPGQPSANLEAAKPYLFNIKGAPGSTIEFIKDAAGEVPELFFTHPYGQLIFTRKG
jgi:CubicO group peptidase (beta-lactamase class C family)